LAGPVRLEATLEPLEDSRKELAMISLEEMTVPDGLSDALDSARRTIGALDLDSIGDAASSAARSVLPDRWFRPKPRRWPFVVAALLLGAAVAAMFLARQPLTAASSKAASPTGGNSGAPEPDASDVVTGPVGSASLRDPASSGPEGADLSRLLEIEVDPEEGLPSHASAG
jgi:hypothetical protein